MQPRKPQSANLESVSMECLQVFGSACKSRRASSRVRVSTEHSAQPGPFGKEDCLLSLLDCFRELLMLEAIMFPSNCIVSTRRFDNQDWSCRRYCASLKSAPRRSSSGTPRHSTTRATMETNSSSPVLGLPIHDRVRPKAAQPIRPGFQPPRPNQRPRPRSFSQMDAEAASAG